jgi:hypothetical protein
MNAETSCDVLDGDAGVAQRQRIANGERPSTT